MTQKPENNHDGLPVSQAMLAKTTVFTSYSKKETFWPKHTALSWFCRNKVISQSKHTLLSSFGKKIDAIGNKTENLRMPS